MDCLEGFGIAFECYWGGLDGRSCEERFLGIFYF